MSADPVSPPRTAARRRDRRSGGPRPRGFDDPRRLPRGGDRHAHDVLRGQPHAVNACRVCVVEVEGARTLVPACSRAVEAGMKIRTDTDRVRHSRRLVMEFLASSVDTSLDVVGLAPLAGRVRADPDRFGAPTEPMDDGERDGRWAGSSPRAAGSGRRRDGLAAGQGRQRALRPRLRPSASSATSASRRAGPTPSTRSRSRSRAAASTHGSRPSTRSRWTRRRACTAATASGCVRPAR